MGFPLSRFQQLANLCSNSDKAYNIFRDFKLVSVVVHSPDDHDFVSTLKNSFESLHERTGKDFAFITFLNPPDKWAYQNRNWMMQQQSFICGENCEDKEFVRLLRNRLNLPQCPVLVLTTDLLSDRYIVMPTDSRHVVEHLERIGAALSTSQFEGSGILNNSNFMNFLRDIGEPRPISTEDGNSLAHNIADLVAVRSIHGQGIDAGAKFADERFIREMASESQMKAARRWVKNTLRELKTILDKAREDGDQDAVDHALRRYSDYLSEYCACRNASSDTIVRPLYFSHKLSFDDCFSEDSRMMSFQMANNENETSPNSCRRPSAIQQYQIEGTLSSLRAVYEDDTITAIHAYNHLIPVLLDDIDINSKYGFDWDDWNDKEFTQDLSPLCMYLGIIVEEEINASIIQFLRKEKGVQMPEFFRIYDPAKSSLPIQTTNKRILLNKRNKLITDNVYSVGMVPIGDANCAIRAMLDSGELNEEIHRFGDQKYFDLIVPFGYKRNDATHPGSMTMEDFDTMYSGFKKIVTGYFPTMIKLKMQMKRKSAV